MGDTSLWRFAFMAGLQDALNPCILTIAAFMILQAIWCKKNGFAPGKPRVLLVVAVFLYAVFFNLGFGRFVLWQAFFIHIAKVLYFILGLLFLFLGGFSFRDWYALRNGRPSLASPKMFPAASAPAIYIGTVMVGGLLAALATIWPINTYMMLLFNGASLTGQWLPVVQLVAIYTFMTLWPVWMLLAFLAVRNVQPSLAAIVSAGVLFAAASCSILIFI